MKPEIRKTALITGGTRRIGKEIAIHLAKKNYHLIIHYHRSENEAKQLQKQLQENHFSCELVSCDFSKDQKLDTFMKLIFQKYPTIDLIINNASIFEKAGLTDTSLDILNRHMDINFKTPFVLTRDFATLYQKGHIINLLDARITRTTSVYLAYDLSKKILAEFTKIAAKMLAPKVRVNGIAPGYILPSDSHPFHATVKEKIPLKMLGNVPMLLEGIDFLIQNQYITGQILFIDGGAHL